MRTRATSSRTYRATGPATSTGHPLTPTDCPRLPRDVRAAAPAQATMERWVRSCFGPCFREDAQALAHLPQLLHALAQERVPQPADGNVCFTDTMQALIREYQRKYARKMDPLAFQQKVQQLLLE